MTGITSPVTDAWLALPDDIRKRAEELAGHHRSMTWPETLLAIATAIVEERKLTALAEEAEWAAKECLWSIYDDYVAIGGTKKPTFGTDRWQPIETAPKDGAEFLAFGSYRYPGDKADTQYFGIAAYSGNPQWPWIDQEGLHTDKFFSHWKPLPAPHETEREAME